VTQVKPVRGAFCSVSVRLHVCASPVLGTIEKLVGVRGVGPLPVVRLARVRNPCPGDKERIALKEESTRLKRQSLPDNDLGARKAGRIH
jgi:hypothetical protein